MSWKVGQVMTTDVVLVRPDTPFKECVEMVRLHGVGALPVLDDAGALLGILSASDLLCKEEVKVGRADPRATARFARDAMTRSLVTVTPETAIAEAARLMHDSSVHHLPVVDRAGRLVGIAGRADLLKVFLRSDESIRREIDEELLPRTFGIPRGGIEVDVREGVVHVAGSADTAAQARLILGFLEKIEGVVAVEGELGEKVASRA
jgi:CBS domain-containing protein